MQVIPIIDPHPSEIAHRIVAEALFEYLFDNGFLDESHALRWIPIFKDLPEIWQDTSEAMGMTLHQGASSE